ncbi:hypothetical protein EDD41_2735 [Luteococcus japonicus]|uniref:Uncharacterized protein n=1 Tax=Luteococcus japonicus TaxID=33984 RepID=A0A3N1ZX85_9ACTN|nr:hypothetical protein [Luteococcus japonicus]ROR55461.1 hypothetical protein EDD41_2735 [Luteococcus japonicus]
MTDAGTTMILVSLAGAGLASRAWLSLDRASDGMRSPLTGLGLLAGLGINAAAWLAFADSQSPLAGMLALTIGYMLASQVGRWLVDAPVVRLAGMPMWAWAVVVLGMLAGVLLDVPVAVGYALGLGVTAVVAVQNMGALRAMERDIASLANPLAAILGISAQTVWELGPRRTADGGLVVRMPAPAIARIPQMDALVAQALPAMEVAHVDSTVLQLAPVSPETLHARQTMTDSGGLVVGIED